MSGSYLGKGFVSQSGGSIAPLAQAGVVFFYFYFLRIICSCYGTVCEQATDDNPWDSGQDPCEYRVGVTVFVVISCWNLLLRLLDRWVGA